MKTYSHNNTTETKVPWFILTLTTCFYLTFKIVNYQPPNLGSFVVACPGAQVSFHIYFLKRSEAHKGHMATFYEGVHTFPSI